MKKMYVIILIVVLALIIPATVYAVSALSKRPTEPDTPIEKPSEKEIEEMVTAEDDDLAAKIPVYIEEDLLFKTNGQFDLSLDACRNEGLNLCPNSLRGILATYPTGAIRHKGEDSLYLMYDTDTGYRLYLFSEGKDYMYTTSGFAIVVGAPHSYEDYRDLKVGDTIEAVERGDAVAGLVRKEVNDVWNFNPVIIARMAEAGYPCTSIHYLTDGILRIEYELLDDRSLVISNMEYRDDYKLVSPNGNTIDYRIIDKDLPQSWRKNK